MSTRDIVRKALQEHEGIRTAAGPFEEGHESPFKTGGSLPPGSPQKRDIPKDHPFDPKSLKPLVQTLWSLSVSLGHVLTAHRQFSRLKSVSFSPDGMVGGRGYVMTVKDVRKLLHEASEGISGICDTLFDEINAPHWKPKLGELEKNDDDFVKLLEDAKGYMDDPEGEAEEDMEEVEARPMPKDRYVKEDELGSKMPDGGDLGNESQGPNPTRQDRPQLTKQAASPYQYDRSANSSVNPDTLPGPRVEHLDRAEQDMGGFQERPHERGYDYPSEWSNDLSGRVGESGLPADTETRTEGYDFGIGDGNGNDAHGQGAGGYANPDPSGKGVYGPRAELPGTPAVKTDGTGLETVEQSTSDMGIPGGGKAASDFRQRYQSWLKKMTAVGQAKLPNDGDDPVARSDTYAGPKGNDLDGISRYGESSLPGDGGPQGTHGYDRDTPNVGYWGEQVSQPYVKWDATTPNMRPDYIYQRDPIQGPYVKQSGEGKNNG